MAKIPPLSPHERVIWEGRSAWADQAILFVFMGAAALRLLVALRYGQWLTAVPLYIRDHLLPCDRSRLSVCRLLPNYSATHPDLYRMVAIASPRDTFKPSPLGARQTRALQ
jgi:hypothetical protein